MTSEPPPDRFPGTSGADVLPFPIPARPDGPAAVRRGAGAADAAPAASEPSPGMKVSWAYRWTWRGAYRLRAGRDVGAGYRIMARAIFAGMLQWMGAVWTADFFMQLAYEAAGSVLASADNDRDPEPPRAA